MRVTNQRQKTLRVAVTTLGLGGMLFLSLVLPFVMIGYPKTTLVKNKESYVSQSSTNIKSRG